MTSEALSNGITTIVVNRALLSDTVFPISLAPIKSVLISQTTTVVGFVIILIVTAITGTISWTALLLPIIWALNIVALIGLLWILAPMNVVFRDLQNLMSTILMIMLIASPIAYTPDMVPQSLKFILSLNPFAYFVIVYQKILIFGQIPSISDIIALIVISFGLLALGNYVFPRAIRSFIDYV
jgi:lipopolysaccharide transport system permease protein